MGFAFVNALGRSVLLNMSPVPVNIDRHGIFRHVGVVQAITVNSLFFYPFAELFQVFLQTVGKHLATGCTGFESKIRSALRIGQGVISLSLTHIIQKQFARQCAIKQGVTFARPHTQTASQRL